jgi:hypothetical protein
MPQDQRIRLSAHGRRVAKGLAQLPAYSLDAANLSTGMLERLFVVLSPARRGVPLDRIAAALVPARGAERERAIRHVMWAMKYGMVERC